MDETAAPSLPSGAFDGIEEFRRIVREALAAAAREGWRELILCDATFAEWPLGERAVAQSLQDWSRTGRKCILLARKWDDATRLHARFVMWRKTWSHIIEARGCMAADPLELPSAIWTPNWVMERRDLERSRGFMGPEPDRRLTLREKLNEWLGRSTPAFPAHTLGL